MIDVPDPFITEKAMNTKAYLEQFLKNKMSKFIEKNHRKTTSYALDVYGYLSLPKR